jgi:CheY-like chemotaxis protein
MEFHKKTILIVEDDNNLRALLVNDLAPYYDIVQASDGEEAVTKVLDHRPDLVLLDLMLPKLDGFKVLERIRTYPDPILANIHVVVLSNLWSQKDILQVQGLKVDDYFVKAHTKIPDVIKKIRDIMVQPSGAVAKNAQKT